MGRPKAASTYVPHMSLIPTGKDNGRRTSPCSCVRARTPRHRTIVKITKLPNVEWPTHVEMVNQQRSKSLERPGCVALFVRAYVGWFLAARQRGLNLKTKFSNRIVQMIKFDVWSGCTCRNIERRRLSSCNFNRRQELNSGCCAHELQMNR